MLRTSSRSVSPSRVAEQDVTAQVRETLPQRRVAGDRTSSHERLVLPGPSLVPQVFAETVEGVDEHPFEPSGRSLGSTS